MKLFVSYNVFDGIELLESSINSIRPAVDFIHVNYQKISNHGNHISVSDMEDLVKLFEDFDLINGFNCYEPNFDLNPSTNEFLKRNKALQRAKAEGYTHFLSIDADEFYKLDEFIKAKEIIERFDYDCTACSVQGYQRLPIWQDSELWCHFVPFIFKIRPQSTFNYGGRFPIIVDPTRIVAPYSKFHQFMPEDIVMHHMTVVRKDLHKKYINSSSTNDSNKHNVNAIVKELQNFQPNETNGVKTIKNIFKIPYKKWGLT